MVFIKAKKANEHSPHSGAYYNSDKFNFIDVVESDDKSFSVNAFIHLSDGYFENIVLCAGFPTEKEAESWLAVKAKQWGLVLEDPNH